MTDLSAPGGRIADRRAGPAEAGTGGHHQKSPDGAEDINRHTDAQQQSGTSAEPATGGKSAV